MDINIRDIQLSECIVQVFIIGGLSKQMSQAQVPLILRLKHKHLIRCHRIMLLHKKKTTLSSKSLQPTSSDCSVHNANIFTHTGIAQGFRGGGGGGSPIYKRYRYLLPHQVGFLRRFGQKMGHTLPILVWNQVCFSRELRECMNVFIVIQMMSKKEREMYLQIRDRFE